MTDIVDAVRAHYRFMNCENAPNIDPTKIFNSLLILNIKLKLAGTAIGSVTPPHLIGKFFYWAKQLRRNAEGSMLEVLS